MKNYIFLALSFCIVVLGKAQNNLVRNYSFEENVVCPTSTTGNPLPIPWIQPSVWQIGAYAHKCSKQPGNSVPFNYYDNSFQNPKTGDGYAMLVAGPQNIRSYLQQQMRDTLIKNKCYYVEFWVSLVNHVKYACNNISALLTKNSVSALNLNVIVDNPQIINFGNPIINDTLNWVKVSTVFIAQGGEKFITLGNFFDFANTNFSVLNPNSSYTSEYYIDDISVYPLDSIILKADAGQDKNITLGDSTFIGSYTNGLTGVRWFNNLGQEIITKAGIPGFFVKPLVSTFYVIEQNVCGQYSKDTVNVNVNAMPLKFMSLTLNSSPTERDLIHINWQTSNEINVSHFNIQRSINGIDFETIGKLTAKNSTINDYSFVLNSPPLDELVPINGRLGVVYYRIVGVDFDGRKTYSPTRSISSPVRGIGGGITVFPNPTKDYINIHSKEKIKEVKMYNSFGQLVKHQNFNNSTNSLIWRVGEVKGFYFINIITQKGVTYNEKIIIN